MSNAVDALLTRNGLGDLASALHDAKITKIAALRALSQEQLAELVPNEEQRRSLLASLDRNAAPSVGPASVGGPFPDQAQGGGRGRGGGRGYGRDDGDRPPRKGRVCRPFFSAEGCKYGEDCKYSHDSELSADVPKSNSNISREQQHEDDVVVPWDNVKLLLGANGAKISAIHHECGTSNAKIEKPQDYSTTYTLKLRGSVAGVAKAKAMIEQFVGTTSQKQREARFAYANEELKHNTRAVLLAAQSNLNNKGTSRELSENVMKRLVATFRFQQPNIYHSWILANNTDKDKFEALPRVIPTELKGIQGILFTELKRVPEMQKRAAQTSGAFGVKTVQFVHPGMSKEERMVALESFKRGEVNENGVVNRLLVTTNDYAKLARKVLIPYVNLVIHFAIPKTKEMYLHQAMCSGRNGHKGISIMFIPPDNAFLANEYAQSMKFEKFQDAAFRKEIETLVFETPTNVLTDPMAQPEPNWREVLKAEAAEKAAASAKKAAEKAAEKAKN